MTLTEDEFRVLLMLYASGMDGIMQAEEVEQMLERTDAVTFCRVRRLFDRMCDKEVLDCIRENKGKYLAAEDAQRRLMNDIRQVVSADGRLTAMEDFFCKAIERVLA